MFYVSKQSTCFKDMSIKTHFFDISPFSQYLVHLKHRIDALPVPVLFQVGGVQAVFHDPRAQGGQAFATPARQPFGQTFSVFV
jgi:hypothetical protein